MWIYIYIQYIYMLHSMPQFYNTAAPFFFLDFVITYCWTHIWAPYVSCKTHHCNVFKAFQKEHIFENMCRHGATASIRRQMLDCINVLDFNLGIKVKIDDLKPFLCSFGFIFGVSVRLTSEGHVYIFIHNLQNVWQCSSTSILIIQTKQTVECWCFFFWEA